MKIVQINEELCHKYNYWITDFIYKSMNRGCTKEWFSLSEAKAKVEELRNYLIENKAFSFIAIEETPIGFVWAYPFGEKDSIYISIIFVSEEYRGKEVGKHLIAMIESIADKDGFKRIWLHTDADNELSRMFYSKLGYKEERIQLSKEL